MKAWQLSEHIGNIDERLIEQAQSVQNYGRMHRKKRVRSALAGAAVFALMACSFGAGAVAFAGETAEGQELLSLPQIDLTMILPDDWSGKYGMEKSGENYVVYSRQVREAPGAQEGEVWGGVLFTIVRYDEAMSPEQFVENGYDVTGYRYLFSTEESTYILHEASDVQWDPADAGQEEAYQAMASQIREIRFVPEGILKDD